MFSSMLSLLGSLRGGSSFITNSLRFRSSASANLSRTFTAPTDRNKWTWSAWVKRGSLSATGTLLSTQTSNANWIAYFSTNDTLLIQTAATTRLQTSQVFRDPSAWYHLVVVYDAANPTANLRIRFYINGLEPTSYTTDARSGVTSNQGEFNTAVNHFIGSGNGSFDGYLTEVHFIDGQALTPASFGAIDSSTGVWAPRPYSGTYGTNGFYLKFANTSSVAALGNDSSGNNNTWTVNNVSLTAGATYDSMIDVPVNYSDGGNGRGNYAVLNAASIGADATLSAGNLQIAYGASATINATMATLGMSSGKWYWEATITASSLANTSAMIGISNNSSASAVSQYPGFSSNGWSYHGNNGFKYTNGAGATYGAAYGVNDVIGVAFDADTRTLTFYKNGVSQGDAYTSLAADTYFPAVGDGSALNTFAAAFNFGQRPFAYTPPAGFRALNTNNLPTPSIVNGANFMAATTYTGNAAARSLSNAVNSVSFQPDLVWIKSRTPGATNHALFDSVRGTTKYLSSNTTTGETTLTQSLTAFGADGFSLGTDTTLVNANANSYVAWQWKAGGAAVSNTQGTITSQVSANTTAGFSVVTYTGTGVNATVGHGLGAAPKMIIVKYRNSPTPNMSWNVYHASLGNTKVLFLDTTGAEYTDSPSSLRWNNTSPTNTVFSIGTAAPMNQAGTSYVAYCFAEIAGFSKFGSYTGNGLPDGPFVFCGFRPRWVMVKAAVGGTGNWCIWDSARNTFNVMNDMIQADLPATEVPGTTNIDFLSNGFKPRFASSNWNGSGVTYIFAAFAEVPSKYALAR